MSSNLPRCSITKFGNIVSTFYLRLQNPYAILFFPNLYFYPLYSYMWSSGNIDQVCFKVTWLFLKRREYTKISFSINYAVSILLAKFIIPDAALSATHPHWTLWCTRHPEVWPCCINDTRGPEQFLTQRFQKLCRVSHLNFPYFAEIPSCHLQPCDLAL